VRTPPPADARLYARLARVLGKPTRASKCAVPGMGTLRLSYIACTVAQRWTQLPYADVTLATGVNPAIQYYLLERQDQFPGVEVQEVWLRKYPLGQTAAQLFGTVGRITAGEVSQSHYKGASQNDVVGQSGLEYYYDRYLRGTDGAERVQVDALGRFQGQLAQKKPTSGNTLKLSLDAKLQQVGQSSLQRSINSNYGANAGAFVAMNPDTGAVYAMGSLPSFDPNFFTHSFTQQAFNQLNSPANNYPLINRAIQSAGPTGSTFKPITATAALESGVWSVGETYDDTGQFCIGLQCRRNAGGAANGVVDLVNAIRVSSDTFFYNLGALTNADPVKHPYGGAIQHWAHLFGIGRKTGIDVGGEVPGNLPSPHWRNEVNAAEARCDKKHHRSPGGCGIADGTNRPWSVGDNVSLAIGQGDVQATPLQLAVVYSALANGGTVVRPHLGLEVDSPDGTLEQKISPPAVRHLNINPSYLQTIRAGLRAAASQPGGTSYDVMGNFPKQVYGKTGTAQYNNQNDYSWYACFVPDTATRTPIAVVVTVAQGGFGDVAAAPVARQILSQWFFGNPGKFTAGSSRTL
jgi:penicillin-binding protein 2